MNAGRGLKSIVKGIHVNPSIICDLLQVAFSVGNRLPRRNNGVVLKFTNRQPTFVNLITRRRLRCICIFSHFLSFRHPVWLRVLPVFSLMTPPQPFLLSFIMDSSRPNGNNLQAMLSAFQEHNQIYYEHMKVRFTETSTNDVGISQSG